MPQEVSRPQFHYSPSKNPYWAKLREAGATGLGVSSDQDTELYRGVWRSRFSDRMPAQGRELHVEIGCNAGHVLVEWARRNPGAAYIGIDWKFKAVYRAAEKARRRELGNTLFLRAHAERLPLIFGEGEIDFLYLFFPDPWPKKRHWKNRYVSAERLRALAPLVREGGVFHVKTDHPGYYEWIRAAVAEVGDCWEIVEESRDLHGGNPDARSLEIPEVTLFERLFIKDGIPIHSLKLKRSGNG